MLLDYNKRTRESGRSVMRRGDIELEAGSLFVFVVVSCSESVLGTNTLRLSRA